METLQNRMNEADVLGNDALITPQAGRVPGPSLHDAGDR
jgi:hypothetical protein